MQKVIAVACLSAALILPLASRQAVAGSETTIEKKTTTTSPSGKVVIENETSRTFKLEGHTEVYTAPADADLNTYVGKDVTVMVGPDGKVTKIERKTTTTE